MNFDDQTLKEYLKRFTKRQKGEPLSKHSLDTYHYCLKKVLELNAIPFALKPTKFLELIDTGCIDKVSSANLIMGMLKLLQVLDHEDMMKHWSPEDLTYDKINNAMKTYKKEVYERRTKAKQLATNVRDQRIDKAD
jgi:hypothetical protein